MKKSIFISVVMIMVLSFLDFSPAMAVEGTGQPHTLLTPQEQEIRMRAKKHLYLGGKDEESLKVQAQLPTVTRKMAPTTETPSEEPEPADSSTD